MHDPMEVVAVLFSSGLSVLLLYAGWLGVKWARRKLEPPRLPEGREIDLLHDRLSRLEEAEHRLAEVEERLDFTERMLAASRPGSLLPHVEEH